MRYKVWYTLSTYVDANSYEDALERAGDMDYEDFTFEEAEAEFIESFGD